MKRKPLSGAIIGILLGLAVAVILARQGVWPPDQLTIFLLPALTGLLAMTLLSIGRLGSKATLVISLLILIPMAIWGAIGIGAINETGELNGGCTVTATSDVDATTVTDTSRADPFRIEADGGLTWEATSPQAFTDYEWEIHTVVGGIPVPIESDTEPNEAGDVVNGGTVDNVGVLAEARGIDLDLYSGVYQVGGSAASCDGFAFVLIDVEGLDPITVGAIILIVLLVIILLVLLYTGRQVVEEQSTTVVDESQDPGGSSRTGRHESGSGSDPGGDLGH